MGIYRNDDTEVKWDDFDCGFSDLGLVKAMCRLDCTGNKNDFRKVRAFDF